MFPTIIDLDGTTYPKVIRGADWVLQFRIYEDDGEILRDITTDIFESQFRLQKLTKNPLFTLTMNNGLEAIDPVNGLLEMTISKELTNALTREFRDENNIDIVYDIELIEETENVIRIVQGNGIIDGDVTRTE